MNPIITYGSIFILTLILIAALIPLGTVIQSTGTADYIGDTISTLVNGYERKVQPYILLGIIYGVTMILTEMSSNTATAIIMTPVVLSVSSLMGFDARPFIFAVCFAASASFSTPIGYQTNLMVYGPGGYKFLDFMKVGLPLSLILFTLAVILIPIIWPFS